MSLWKCLILIGNIKRYFWRVTILLFSDKLLEYWILHFSLVLSEFSPQSLQLSVLVSLPQQRGIRKLKWRTEKVTALLWKPGSFLLLMWHCHQAEAVIYQERRGERRSWTGAWGRGCRQTRDVTDCIVSWETHPSNRHLWFCAGSLRKEAACPSWGILEC